MKTSKKLAVAGSAVLAGGLAVTGALVVTDPGESKTAASVGASAATVWPLVQSGAYSGTSQLNGIVAAPDGSVWAGGSLVTQRKSLLKKLSGGKWSDVALPASLGAYDMGTLGASSASDVWALGRPTVSGAPALLHWNGTKWAKSALPASFTPDQFAVVNAKNAWMTGYGPVGKRWNGTAWSDSTIGINPVKIDALSASNAWAAGFVREEAQPAVARWNGTAWSRVPFPKIGGIDQSQRSPAFNDVEVVAANDVWAVGAVPVKDAAGKTAMRSLFAHWNGAAWSHTLGAPGTGFAQVESDGAGGIWILDDTKTLRHRTAAGAWTAETLAAPAGRTALVYGMARQAGTKTIWVAGNTIDAKGMAATAIWRSNS
ncbi:hypothetical protein [Actinomadura xylanilytica]|uniref:hypothetical protein n=1 Tax=Actinomadura xylanilytica TaxID=887459 RepID=UPI00255A7F27|nr:hypothetical protein [Actinomadura xylanilytica]MDL4775955.1 hypothetical protein [Actinomadura xylanilytica]